MNAIQQLLTNHLDIWTDADTEKKAGRGRSSGNAASVYGIRKLRELILELAVRGKLVPQDANDEPASALLKRIQVEKAKLIAKGKIKNEKPLPSITDEENTFPLPQGWARARLGDVAYSQAGFAFKSNGFNESGLGLPLIRIRDVGQVFTGTYFDGEYRDEFVVRQGDYLISMDGEFRVAKWINGNALLNQRVSRLIFLGLELAQRFIAEALQARLRELQGVKAYTTVDHLSGGQISNSVIALPPVAEQHRIVAKVNELMVLCDQLEIRHNNAAAAHEKLVSHLLATLTQSPVRGEPVEPHPSTSSGRTEFEENWQRIAAHFDTLFTTEASIETLKQTLLQLAVMGKLVPQDPNDEPASVLLKRIQAEKAKLVAEGKIKKDKPLPLIGDEEKPFALPQGWEWVRFNDLINPAYPISYGVLVPGADEDDGIPFVRIADLDIKNPPEKPEKSISREIDCQYERTRLEGGEILMGVVGSIGKLGVAPNSWKGANIARAICRIKASDFLNRDYIVTLLQSRFMQNNFIGDTKTLAQPTLNVGLIRLSLTPLPPLAEQHRIVAKVDELMALCDQLKTRLTQASQLQQKLADVVVEQAIA